MSYADIRFQRIEENINELKESIKFLSDIMHDHLLDKNNEKKNKKNDDDEENNENNDEIETVVIKSKTKKDKKPYYFGSSLVEWVKSPSTIICGTSIIIAAFTSHGLYHFYDKK